MYNKEMNIINPFSKVISLILFIISMFLVSNIYLLLIINSFFLYLSLKDNLKYNSIFIVIIILLSILSTLISSIIIYPKVLTILEYIIIMTKNISRRNFRYLYEQVFYSLKSKKITNFYILLTYFPANYKKAWNEYDSIRKGLGYSLNIRLFFKQAVNSFIKAKEKIDDIKFIYRLRLYNMYKKRTYHDKMEWVITDSIYVFLHLILLILTLYIGR